MDKQKINQFKAFTLVELIVVITILAILWTIAFISLQWYSRDARDSVRISDMKNIETAFELDLTKRWKVLIPEDKIDITASGTLIGYQWYAWEKVLNNIWVHGWWKDPVDDTYYTFMTNSNLTSYQILWYLESESEISFNTSLIEDSFAADYTKRYPKLIWDQLWVLVSSGSLEPVQKWLVNIDIINTTEELVAYVNESDIISWTWVKLKNWLNHRVNINWSCSSILKNGKSKWNWLYIIDPEKNGLWFEVYCDMTTDWGWWTKISEVEILYNPTDTVSSPNFLNWWYNESTELLDIIIDNSNKKEWMTFHDNTINNSKDYNYIWEFESNDNCTYQTTRSDMINPSSKYSIKQLSIDWKDDKYIKKDWKYICWWFTQHEWWNRKCHSGFSWDIKFNYFSSSECSVWSQSPEYCYVSKVNAVIWSCNWGSDVFWFYKTNTLAKKIFKWWNSNFFTESKYYEKISEYNSSTLYIR